MPGLTDRRTLARAGVLLAALALLLGCALRARDSHPPLSEADQLHLAVHRLTSVIVYDIMSPPQASRVYAYSSVAAYEALRPGHPEYRTLAGQLTGLTPAPAPDAGAAYDWTLAATHAFMTVGRAMTFSHERMDSLRAQTHAEARRRGVSGAVFDRSVAYGERVAQHILRWAGSDRYLQTRGYPKYSVTEEPGRWIPTPPAYMDGVEPHWGELRPFVLDSAAQYRPAPPPPFDTTAGSAFYRAAAEVYETGTHLTPEQRAIASFWDCNPYVMNVQGHAMYATKKISPGGHWMGIIALASRRAKLDVMQSAEAYARATVAMADAFISTWDVKYRTAVIRPETVIGKYIDERWEPLLQTPPFPEYPSGHSVVSMAVATVLTRQFGAPFALVDSTEMEYGLPARSFPSFEAAAQEAGISRLYGGIHYRPAVTEGLTLGRRIGEHVLTRLTTRERPGLVASADARSRGSAAGAAH